MENLKLISSKCWGLLPSEDKPLIGHAFDSKRKRFLFVTARNYLYTVYLIHNPSIEGGGTDLRSEFTRIDLPDGHRINAIAYLTEKQSLILATTHTTSDDGFLFEFNYNNEKGMTELPFYVKNGVTSMAASPDEAYLAIQTGTRMILLITLDFSQYPFAINFNPTSTKAKKRPTSRKAKKRKATKYEFVSPIYWREDGKYFATLLCKEQGSCKLLELKVWKGGSGVLHSSFEVSKVFVGAALDWMPNDAVAATVYDRKAEHKCPMTVVLKEKKLKGVYPNTNGGGNGMGEIPQRDGMYDELKWSRSSNLLAAVVRDERYDAFEIWSFRNNCWTLKQEFRFSSDCKVNFMWDPQSLQLFCWTDTLRISVFNFIWVTAVMENSIALVIDNSKINVFTLDIPPGMRSPMPLFSLKFSSAIYDMAFFFKELEESIGCSPVK